MESESNTSGINRSNGSSNDSSSPFFLSPSDNPSTILVSKVFDGTGFSAWKRSMTLALYAKNKFGFVDGSIEVPDQNSSNHSNWNRVNSMIISWLLNSLIKDIADSVLFLSTAKEIWDELHQRYEQANGSLIYQIQKQIYSSNQGTEDFSTYFTKMKKIWDELNMVQEIPSCNCGAALKMKKFIEEQRLIQLLMGLNESYKAIRGQILMMNPLPSIAAAHSLLIHEEKQREISINPNIVESAMAMNVNHTSRKNLQCAHCRKPGHVKSQCYRLHGFPADFKFTKSQKKPDQSSINATIDSSSSAQINDINNIITSEQFQQLMNMFQNNSVNNNSSVNSVITNGAMDSAGPFVEE